MNSDFAIRSASRADIPLLLSWRKAMFLDMGQGVEAEIDAAMPAFGAWLEEIMGQPGRLAAFLCEAENEPRACAIVWIYDWFPRVTDTSTRRGYIFSIYTLPAWRGRGCARRLVRHCLDWLREQGIRSVALHASEQGLSVYAREGFHPPFLREMTLHMRAEEGLPVSEP